MPVVQVLPYPRKATPSPATTFSAVIAVPIRTSSGSQTVSIPGLPWTPVAARVLYMQPEAFGVEDIANPVFAQGFAAGGQERNTGIRLGSEYRWLSGVFVNDYTLNMYCHNVAFTATGLRMDVVRQGDVAQNAISPIAIIEVFGGLVTDAHVSTWPTSSGGHSITTGFQPRLLFTGSTADSDLTSRAVIAGGFAAFKADGTINGECRLETIIEGQTPINRALPSLNWSASLVSSNSTSYTISHGSAPRYNCALALGLDPSAKAWAGLATLAASADGITDIIGDGTPPDFTPHQGWAILCYDTDNSGNAGNQGKETSFNQSIIRPDGSGYGVNVREIGNGGACAVIGREEPFYMTDRAGSDPTDMDFDSWISGGIRVNANDVGAFQGGSMTMPIAFVG